MNLKTKLLMRFKTDTDNIVSISIDEPREDITETEIKTVMNLIIDKNIFSIKGAHFVKAVDAKIVQTDTTEYDLAL